MFGCKKKKVSADHMGHAMNDIEVAEIADAPICPIPVGKNAYTKEKDTAELVSQAVPGPESAPISGLVSTPVSGAASHLSSSVDLALFQKLTADINTPILDGGENPQTWPASNILNVLQSTFSYVEEHAMDDQEKRVVSALDRESGMAFGVFMYIDKTPDHIKEILFVCVLAELDNAEDWMERLSSHLTVSTLIAEDNKLLVAAKPLVNDPFSEGVFLRQLSRFLKDVKIATSAIIEHGMGRSMYSVLTHFFSDEKLDLDRLQNSYAGGAFMPPMVPEAMDKGQQALGVPHDGASDLKREALPVDNTQTVQRLEKTVVVSAPSFASEGEEEDCEKCGGTGRRFLMACRLCDGTGVS